MAPLIGITCYGRHETQVESRHYDAHYTLPALYVDAVRRAGGTPVIVPPVDTDWDGLIARLDGFIIAGGADIDPMHYDGNTNHPDLTDLAPDRDIAELGLVKALMQHGKRPTLLICRGMQVANIVAGGTMTEHIPDIRTPDIHRDDTGGWTVQPVAVEQGTALAKAMAAMQVETYSGHHQAVAKVGQDLVVNAVAPDGIIEGLELPGHPFFLAVQWHPEMSAANDATQQNLFGALVEAAAQ